MVGSDDGSLRDRVYRALRRRIIHAEYQPGTRLIERDLAAEFEVSRIPLREALRLLSAEGLVVIVPGKGTIVNSFTPRDVRDLYDVRQAVEPLAARLAAGRVNEAGAAELRAILDEAHVTTDPHSRTGLNTDFHNVVIRLADNPLLVTMTRPLNSRMRWLFALAAELDPIPHIATHEQIFAAITAGDGDEAARLSIEHVEAGRAEVTRLAHSWTSGDIDPEAATHRRRRTTGEARTEG